VGASPTRQSLQPGATGAVSDMGPISPSLLTKPLDLCILQAVSGWLVKFRPRGSRSEDRHSEADNENQMANH
jgi:hypothetical protein